MMRALLLILLCFSLAKTNAQLLNGGFETMNSRNLPVYWGGLLRLIDVQFDSSGNAHYDSIVYDQANYFINTTDVHSGQRAIELRNGYNYTKGTSLPGNISSVFDTTGYIGFPDNSFSIAEKPKSVQFYTKFFPKNSDTASVSIIVYDSSFNEVGQGLGIISGTISTYTLLEVPILYTSSNFPAFISIRFSTIIPGKLATMGSRLLIDDVSLEYSQMSVTPEPEKEIFTIYPNPANYSFMLNSNRSEAMQYIQITDIFGKTVLRITNTTQQTFSCDHLSAGVYFVSVKYHDSLITGKMMIER